MPELPEVETTCRGISPHILEQKIVNVIIRAPKLRWPIPKKIAKLLPDKKPLSIERRAKYILLHFDIGTLIIHLGMSGRLQTLFEKSAPGKHDHVDIVFANGCCLRYTDPRRFGCMLWTEQPALEHKLLSQLGPEPFSKEFSAQYLYNLGSKRKIPIKNFIMDSKVVVGVGNIYASEALFSAHINPIKPTNQVTKEQFASLIKHIKSILRKSIKQGGTTLKDFLDNSGKPGYFSQQLQVYGRSGESCHSCGTAIESITLGQRNTFFCPNCQS